MNTAYLFKYPVRKPLITNILERVNKLLPRKHQPLSCWC